MSVTDKLLDGITKVIRLDGKIEMLSHLAQEQQRKIDDINSRLIRIETLVEVAAGGKSGRALLE